MPHPATSSQTAGLFWPPEGMTITATQKNSQSVAEAVVPKLLVPNASRCWYGLCIRLSVCPSVCLSVRHLSVGLLVCLSVCVSRTQFQRRESARQPSLHKKMHSTRREHKVWLVTPTTITQQKFSCCQHCYSPPHLKGGVALTCRPASPQAENWLAKLVGIHCLQSLRSNAANKHIVGKQGCYQNCCCQQHQSACFDMQASVPSSDGATTFQAYQQTHPGRALLGLNGVLTCPRSIAVIMWMLKDDIRNVVPSLPDKEPVEKKKDRWSFRLLLQCPFIGVASSFLFPSHQVSPSGVGCCCKPHKKQFYMVYM